MAPRVISEVPAMSEQMNKLTRIARLNLGEGGKSGRSSDGNDIRKFDFTSGVSQDARTANRGKANAELHRSNLSTLCVVKCSTLNDPARGPLRSGVKGITVTVHLIPCCRFPKTSAIYAIKCTVAVNP
jgi:hypothetical protein